MITFYKFKLTKQLTIVAIAYKVKGVGEVRNVNLRFSSGLKQLNLYPFSSSFNPSLRFHYIYASKPSLYTLLLDLLVLMGTYNFSLVIPHSLIAVSNRHL